MATIEEALGIAVDHHISGRLADAETIYGRILEVDPRNAPALHLAGFWPARRTASTSRSAG